MNKADREGMAGRSVRVEPPDTSNLMRAGRQAGFANDSLHQNSAHPTGKAARRSYVTRSRVAAIEASLGARERTLLASVARLRLVSGDQLTRLHYEPCETGSRLARIDLARLCAHQVLARLGRSIGGRRAGSRGYLYTLGVTGQRIVQPGRHRYRQPWTPNPAFTAHALAVSELYVTLHQTASNRLLAFDTEPGCWRSYFGPGGAPATLKPDSFLTVETGEYEDSYFIEIDRGTEAGTRITAKAKAYVRYWQSGREQAATGVFPWVLWVTTNEARQTLMVEAISRLPPEHWQLFTVTTTEHATAHILGSGPEHDPG